MSFFQTCDVCPKLKRAAFDQAAEGEAAMLLGVMKTRGCKEEFTPNPELLKDGKVRRTVPYPTLMSTPSTARHTCLTHLLIRRGFALCCVSARV